MGFDFNPSFWFVCRLCKQVFPTTTKLKDHKLKNHLGDCLRIKCIIFEEKFLDYGWSPCEDPINQSLPQNKSSPNHDQDPPFYRVEKFQNPYVSITPLTPEQLNSAFGQNRSGQSSSRGIKEFSAAITTDLPNELYSTTKTASRQVHDEIQANNRPLLKLLTPIKKEPDEVPRAKVHSEIEAPSILNPNENQLGNSLELEDGEFIVANIETHPDSSELFQFKSTIFCNRSLGSSNSNEDHFSDQLEDLEVYSPKSEDGTSDDFAEVFRSPDGTVPNGNPIEEPEQEPALSPLVSIASNSESESEFEPLSEPSSPEERPVRNVNKNKTKKRKMKRKGVPLKSPKLKKAKQESQEVDASLDVDLDLDLPLNQWLDKQKDKNPSNLILIDPDPSTVDDFTGVNVKNPVKCKLCQESFNSEKKLRSHVTNCWSMNKNRHRYCHLCNKLLCNNRFFKYHNGVYHSSEPRPALKPLKCSLCPKECLKKDAMKKHEASHNPAKNYSCTICGKSFKFTISLKNHMRSHSSDTSEGPWKCSYDPEICQATFKRESNLIKHLETHTDKNVRDYACAIPDCGKTFSQLIALKAHTRKHERDSCATTCGDLPCAHKERAAAKAKKKECQECSLTFKTKGTFENHMIKFHGKETKFKCRICGKCFLVSGHAKDHERMHTGDRGERVFKCDVANCNSSFYNKSSLTAHRSKKHVIELGLGNFVCHTCGKIFAYEHSLNNHIKYDHENYKPYKCSYDDSCSEAFRSGQQLTEHVRVAHTGEKPYQCEKCGKSYARKLAFTVHLKAHEGVKRKDYFSCSLCPRTFHDQRGLGMHVKSHQRGTDFYCRYCDFQCCYKPTLTKHEKIHMETTVDD